MIDFNFDPASHFEVRTDEDGGEIRFNDNTFGIKSTSEGYSLTNDWNERHFTIGFSNDSFFYHLTREDVDDPSGKWGVSRAEFIAEMFMYIRSIAPEIPEDELQFEFVGKLNIDGIRDYFINHGVVDFDENGVDIDFDRAESHTNEIVESPSLFGTLLGSVFDPVRIDELRDVGDIVFFYPRYNELGIIVLYPNNRVGLVQATDILDNPFNAGGSQIIDHTIRSITTD